MADDFLGSLQGVLQNEIQQQQATDWGSILANALAQGAKGAAAGFAEAKPNDYGSQLASALVGGLATGYGQGRQRDIRNDILGGLATSIDATKQGQYGSLADALKANELGNLANAVTTDNYNFDLGLDRTKQKGQMENDLALQLIKDKIPVELEDYKNRQRFATDQNIRQQNSLFGVGGQGQGQSVLSPEQIAKDPNKPYSQKVVELSRYFQQTTRSTPNEALKQANNVLKNQVLDSADLPESTQQILNLIPQGLQRKAFDEIGILQLEANSKAVIDDVYGRLENISTLSAINPRSTEGAVFEAGQGAVNLNVVEKYKGVMSENDYQRMKGLLPSKWDTKERLAEKKKLMMQMITQISNSATPVLSQFGVKGFEQRKQTKPQEFLPSSNGRDREKTQEYPEGTIIKNAQGERKIMQNGKFVPYQGGR